MTKKELRKMCRRESEASAHLPSARACGGAEAWPGRGLGSSPRGWAKPRPAFLATLGSRAACGPQVEEHRRRRRRLD